MTRHSDAASADRLYKEAIRAIAVLEGAGHAARLAGGCVRDRLLGILPSDYDIATDATPELVMRAFKAAGLRTVPTGIAHGTVTLVMPSGPVEITTLRTDVATDGRHAEVAFGRSFEDDAARRDFTINALFEDRGGTIYDYFAGRADLDAGVLRFVGDASRRIHEDYLRILRFFRFQARFGYQPAPGTLAAIAAAADGLARISQERISGELLKTAAAAQAVAAFQAMADCGVMRRVLPELAERPLASEAAFQRLRALFGGGNPPAVAALAFFLLHGEAARPNVEQLRALGRRLRLATRETDVIVFAGEALARAVAATSGTRADQLDFVDACERAAGDAAGFTGLFVPLLKALGSELSVIEATELQHVGLRRARMPLDGARLQTELGISAGPELGRLLEMLRRDFRNGIWSTPEAGLLKARQLIAGMR